MKKLILALLLILMAASLAIADTNHAVNSGSSNVRLIYPELRSR